MIYGFAALIPGRVFWVVTATLLSVAALSVALLTIPVKAAVANINAMYIFNAAMILISTLAAINSWRLHLSQFKARQALLDEKNLREKLVEKLEHASRRDPLTNLANRRYWGEILERYWSDNQSLCLAIIDIDHFKNINDRFGHQAGDAILTGLATLLETNVSGHGFAARLGGDEFAVLLLGPNTEQHHLIFTDIMLKAKRLELNNFPEARVTLSIGIALREAKDQNASDLMQRADRQLYIAKNKRDSIAVDFVSRTTLEPLPN